MENKIFLKCRTWRENLAREAEHPRKSTGKVRPTCVLFSSSFTLAKMWFASECYYTSHGLCFLKHALQGNEKPVALLDSTGTTPLALNVGEADLHHQGDCFKEGPKTSRRCSNDSRQCLQRLKKPGSNGIWPMAKVKSPEGRSPGNCMQPRTGQFCCRKLMLTSHLWFSEQRRPWHEPSSAGKHSNHILTSSPGQAEGLTHSHIQSLSGSKNREFRCPVATIKEFQKADLGSLEEINFQESHAMIIGSELCSGKG